MILAIVRFLHAWRRYNTSLRELNQLGDRELADIGISRSDIPRVAWDDAAADGSPNLTGRKVFAKDLFCLRTTILLRTPVFLKTPARAGVFISGAAVAGLRGEA
jgi:uncharacterized protein YjiS (DUF1127 family)